MMINKGTYEKVRFRKTVLICPVINGTPHVLLKHIAEDIGLNLHSVRRGLNKHPRLSIYLTEWSGSLEEIQSYKYLTIPITRVAAWLYSININKVGTDAKAILEVYQDECDQVLFQHFYGAKNTLVNHIDDLRVINQKISRYEAHVSRVKKRIASMKSRKSALIADITKSTQYDLFESSESPQAKTA